MVMNAWNVAVGASLFWRRSAGGKASSKHNDFEPASERRFQTLKKAVRHDATECDTFEKV
jgi:hypothetical protein